MVPSAAAAVHLASPQLPLALLVPRAVPRAALLLGTPRLPGPLLERGLVMHSPVLPLVPLVLPRIRRCMFRPHSPHPLTFHLFALQLCLFVTGMVSLALTQLPRAVLPLVPLVLPRTRQVMFRPHSPRSFAAYLSALLSALQLFLHALLGAVLLATQVYSPRPLTFHLFAPQLQSRLLRLLCLQVSQTGRHLFPCRD